MALADIWAAITVVTSDPHDQRVLLYATEAESGAMPVQQHGGPGMGYYQIEPGQGVSQAQANDPVAATTLFYNRWPVHACASEQGQLWQTDPDQAATNAAGCAERNAAFLAGAPDGGYNAGQRAAQRAGWQQVMGGSAVNPLGFPVGVGPLPNPAGILTGAAGSAGIAVGAAASNAASAALSALLLPLTGPIEAGKALLANHTFWIRLLLVLGGFATVLIGIKNLVGIDAVPVPV